MSNPLEATTSADMDQHEANTKQLYDDLNRLLLAVRMSPSLSPRSVSSLDAAMGAVIELKRIALKGIAHWRQHAAALERLGIFDNVSRDVAARMAESNQEK